MPSLQGYLYEGEQVRQSISKRKLFGQEELAATDTRVIHVKRGKNYSIGYEFIVSISSVLIIDWKWGKHALHALLLSLLFIGALMILPAAIIQSSDGISGEINSYTNSLVSDILPQGYTQSDMASVPGMSQFNPFPSITTGTLMVDLTSQANALSMSASGILQSLVYFTIALTIIFILIFLLKVKRGIVLKTLIDTQIFYYPKRLEWEAQEFIITVSALCRSTAPRPAQYIKNNERRTR